MAVGIEQTQLEHAAACGAGDAAELHAPILGNVRAINHAVGGVEQLCFRLGRATRPCLDFKTSTGSDIGRWLQRDPAARRRCGLPTYIRRQQRIAITCDQASTDQCQRGGRMLAQRGGQVGYALCAGYIGCFRQQQQRAFAGRECAGLAGIGSEHHHPACRVLEGGRHQAEIQQRGDDDLQCDHDPPAARMRGVSTQLAHAGDDHDHSECHCNPQVHSGGVHGCASSASR